MYKTKLATNNDSRFKKKNRAYNMKNNFFSSTDFKAVVSKFFYFFIKRIYFTICILGNTISKS